MGTKWVYQEGDRKVIEEITASEEKDGKTFVTISEGVLGERSTSKHFWAVSNKGIFWIGEVFAKADDPVCFLKLPHVSGQKWKADVFIDGTKLTTTSCSAHGPEQVEVPAGKYQAIRVEETIDLGDGSAPGLARTWYAPGIGKVVFCNGATRVLTSFTPRK